MGTLVEHNIPFNVFPGLKSLEIPPMTFVDTKAQNNEQRETDVRMRIGVKAELRTKVFAPGL